MTELKDKLSIITESLNFFTPELVLTGLILIIVLVDLIGKSKSYILIISLSFLGVGATLVFDINQFNYMEDRPIPLFLSMLQLDQAAIIWKILLDVGMLLILLLNLRSDTKHYKAELIALLCFILLGAHTLVMSVNLLMVYLSIEIMSIGAYVLTTYSLKAKNYEAAIKYLLFGGVASAVMLYGLSLIYTYSGSLIFISPLFTENLLEIDTLPLLLAGFMVIGGLLFKISAVPFHIWTPDVYEVTPTPVVAFFSLIPKLAGFAILIKLVLVINLFGLVQVPWPKLMGGVAVLTLTVGNFSALWQQNVKRMLAYSSIAHSGFLLLGLVAFSETGFQSVLFYAAIYILMNVAVFSLVNYFEKNGAVFVADYKGLINTFPVLTIFMVVIMISLTGLPPTAGFTAKLFVFSAIWESYSTSSDG
ncbi:NADH-quinone oxidoreductase subunit N, partial [Fulvivirga sp. RKSG066]|uniref:proton-conducting transporter transmembrane domain-containing protein n=1 Tax=Fulvivirga aurantia TaxID=2529383 RepID=UPI0012BCE7A7|nr:NADH-quinone oxidoreductase subunit N [Fulvivirga aurantia]